ncbi:alpha/beta fold hydrolase [Leucobacter tenebrionis]|uniref:alpha/beta fold hydrolase n=1 Tax=Leucobacter tenebrionis TaxID=2873270 RepID=UPI001CA697CF|nr:alpha/beta hydrolase [Leucobacter tenebrionis]QZY51022.1 alpha/beta hydrolase [Leucobacter tenebrionis]
MTSAQIPIVLLHGVGLDRSMWQPLAARLEAAGRPCVVLDLPGHGGQPPLRRAQTLASLAADVVARLPEGRAHLVGFSLGALIAQHIARFSPERVATLTSVNSVCRRTPEEAERVEARLATAGDDFTRGVEASIERWFPAATTAVPQEIVERTRAALLANDVESYLHAYTVFARGDHEIGPELGRIAAPSLAITGELDPGSTPEMSRRLAAAIPDCRVVIVPNTRHMMPVEDTPALAAAITAFIAESEGAEHERAQHEHARRD